MLFHYSFVSQRFYKRSGTIKQGVLVIPDCPNQFLYTQYTEMIIKEVALLSRPELLTLPSQTNIRHPIHQSLQPRAAIISGKQQGHSCQIHQIHVKSKIFKSLNYSPFDSLIENRKFQKFPLHSSGGSNSIAIFLAESKDEM